MHLVDGERILLRIEIMSPAQIFIRLFYLRLASQPFFIIIDLILILVFDKAKGLWHLVHVVIEILRLIEIMILVCESKVLLFARVSWLSHLSIYLQSILLLNLQFLLSTWQLFIIVIILILLLNLSHFCILVLVMSLHEIIIGFGIDISTEWSRIGLPPI